MLAEGFNLTNHVNALTRNGKFGAGAYPSSPSPTFGQITAVGEPTVVSVGRARPILRAGQRRGADCSTERLIEASALSSDERVLSTTTFRRIEPLTPVNPSCSEPLSVSR